MGGRLGRAGLPREMARLRGRDRGSEPARRPPRDRPGHARRRGRAQHARLVRLRGRARRPRARAAVGARLGRRPRPLPRARPLRRAGPRARLPREGDARRRLRPGARGLARGDLPRRRVVPRPSLRPRRRELLAPVRARLAVAARAARGSCRRLPVRRARACRSAQRVLRRPPAPVRPRLRHGVPGLGVEPARAAGGRRPAAGPRVPARRPLLGRRERRRTRWSTGASCSIGDDRVDLRRPLPLPRAVLEPVPARSPDRATRARSSASRGRSSTRWC